MTSLPTWYQFMSISRKHLTLAYFKSVKCGFFPMDPVSIGVRSFLQSAHIPSVKETNPQMKLDVEIFKTPRAPYLITELLDGHKYEFSGKEITTYNIMEPVVFAADQFYFDEVFCEADQYLMKNIDDEPK